MNAKFYSFSIAVSYLALVCTFTTKSNTDHTNQLMDKKSSLIAVVHNGENIPPKKPTG